MALLYKTHQALVDGVETVDLGQVLLDKDPGVKILGGDEWRAHRHPSNAGLLAGALHDNLTDSDTALDTARQAFGAAQRTADRLTSGAGKVLAGLTGRGPDRGNALSGELSQQRRVVGVETTLADYRTIRDEHGGTINDVILATLTGALRAWLMTRSESMGGLRQIQAVVPVSVIDRELEATSLGSQIAAHFVTLPIAEASPVVRLHQVSYSFQTYKDTGRGVAANRLAGIAGFAPTTFHAIGARVAAAETRRGFQLSITNVPGPQSPLYAAGARMLRTFPIPPLLPGQALAIGVTSYDGQVFYGITADRDLVPDADVLGQCVTEALDRAARHRDRRPAEDPARSPQEDRPETMRIYLPTTMAGLARLRDDGSLPASAERYVADGDSEEEEYAALMAAAVESAELVEGAGRRVVVVADVADPDDEVPFRGVVAVHADPADRPAGSDPEDDLGWYATQEMTRSGRLVCAWTRSLSPRLPSTSRT